VTGTKRILVVDDIAANRRVLRAMLEAEGYAVFEAADGVEALDQLEKRAPLHAVISDILMPNMDGYRLCNEIRRSERWHALPFIFYSSTYLSPSDEALARQLGGDKFMAKPASAADIVAALEELVRARREVPPAPTLPQELELMRKYSTRLVSKLEEQNTELRNRTRELEREMTGRAEAERALRESERRFGDLLEHVELVSLMLDRHACITYCNDYLLRLTGWRGEDVIGKNWFEMFVPPELALQGIFADLLADRPSAWHHVNPILTRLGERRLIQWNNTVLRATNGAVIGTASIGEDITERKQAEADLTNAAHRMQALARRLVEVQETAQRRLSTELHDRIGQSLAALAINLNIIDSAVPAPQPAALADRLRDSGVLLKDAIAAVRDVIGELRPAMLDDYGLLAALRWVAQQHGRRTGMETQVEGQEPAPRLAPEVDMALLRIAQEALANALKHSQARRASLQLQCRDRRLTLIIADDGVGFEPNGQLTSGGHWGLAMMRERAEAVGGRLHVESAPGAGTRIMVELERPA
jgi:PAS domain S-box-containing protein